MVKCPGVIGWKANARLPRWKVWENAPLLPGGGGGGRGWALLELTDALPPIDFFSFEVLSCEILVLQMLTLSKSPTRQMHQSRCSLMSSFS